MTKILLFEPWHLGDVAVALSVTRQFMQPDVEFALVCNEKWKEWALTTGIVKKVFSFTPPWTARRAKDKYNPFRYNLSDFAKLRREVLRYNPDAVIELRGDIRAKLVLSLLFRPKLTVISSTLAAGENVYRRGEALQKIIKGSPNAKPLIAQPGNGKITVFFGASDVNRELPVPTAISLLSQLQEAGYSTNWVLQPGDDRTKVLALLNQHSLSCVNLLQGNVATISHQISQSSLVISTDSGWLHLAHFYNRPTIGLFGFDTIKTWLPPGSLSVTPPTLYPDYYRYKKKFRDLRPLLHLPVTRVIQLVQESGAQAGVCP